jgi:hypothetical protein
MKRTLVALCIGVDLGLSHSLALANAADQSQAAVPSALGKPRIKFDQTVYDFGNTCKVEQVTGKFTFVNAGDGVLKLAQPSTSCGCTVAAVKPEVLQPGEHGDISFSLYLGPMRAILQKEITVSSNDPETPKTVLKVRADYTPLFEMAPGNFNINLHKGDSASLTARVTRTDGQLLRVTKIKPSQPWIEAKAEPEPNSDNRAVRITGTIRPTGNPRYFSEFIRVCVDGSDDPAFALTVYGKLSGDLSITPESVYWPIADPEKATGSRRITVKSLQTEKPLEIRSASSSLPNLSVEASVQPDGRSGEILIKLNTVPSHTTNGVIRFETNFPSQPEVEVPVAINVIKQWRPPGARRTGE